MNHVTDVHILKDFSYWKPLIAFLIWSTFAFSKCHAERSFRGEKTTLILNLANLI